MSSRFVSPSVARYAALPDLPPPAGHEFASCCWLVARHPVLAQLARRVPDAVDTKGDVLPWVLADAVIELDTHRAAWRDYRHDWPAPTQRRAENERDYDARYDAWVAAGPPTSEVLEAIGVMSRTEVARLRLLATFSPEQAPRFTVGMLDGFDHDGQALITDWLTAIAAHHGLPAGTRAGDTTDADADGDGDGDGDGVSAEEYYSSIWWEDRDQDDTDLDDQLDDAAPPALAPAQAEAVPGQLVIPAPTTSPTGTGAGGVGIDRDWWQHDTTTSATGGASVGSDVAGADRDDGWSR